MPKSVENKKLSGEYFKNHIWTIFDKLTNYGIQLKQLKELFKGMIKAQEMTVSAVEAIVSINNLISDNIRKGRPDSELAEKIPFTYLSIVKYEKERLERWSNLVNNIYPLFENSYEKKMQYIKNYLKNFEREDKDRLIAIKKIKSKKYNNRDSQIVERDDIADKYFDLRTAREDCLRKLMIDENILYTSLLELNNLLLKNELFLNENYSLKVIRPYILGYEHILQNINNIPPESDFIIKNPSINIEANINNNESIYNISYVRPESNHSIDYYKFKSLSPISPRPKVVIFSYISIDANEIDLTYGDIIIIYSDIVDGWQYGINITSERCGWFPSSFTIESKNEDDLNLMNRFINQIQKANETSIDVDN